MIYPQTKRSPLEIESTRVEESNSFRSGQFVARTASGWVLADNTDRDKWACGWIAAADPNSFRVVTSRGQVVEWSDHGHGSSGYLWLGTSGGVVTSEPVGSGVQVVQYVALIWDADNVQLFPETPQRF